MKNLFKRKISQNAIPGLEGDLRTADALRSQPHRFSLSGPHDNGQDRSTNRHSALHKPMDGFPELPSDIEGHISPQIPGRNHFHPSEVASSTNPARQTRALDDQGYRLSRPLEGSEVTARQSIEDDAHSRIHRVIDSGVSSGIRRSPMAQHSTAPWTPRTNPTPGYSQPIPFGDGQRHVNQELDRPHDQRFEQDQTSRDQECGPGKPPSFPHATFETQYLRGLSEHASSIATRDLANAYAFGQNTTIRPPSPRQERTMPLGVQREPRKQSNILSILNADPDEPSSRGQAPRSRTPPHHYSSMPDPARPASHAERRDREGHTRNDVVSSTPTSGEMRPPFAPRPAQAFATGTDWASRLISGEGRSRQLFEYPERSSSADLHNLAGHNFRTRTPLTSLGYGASMRTLPPEPASLMPLSRSVERLQSGMHDERASENQAYMQEHGQSTHQDHRPFFFNAARDRGGQAGQGMSNPPPNPVTRSADDFLLNGSGTYRGRSAQFDRHLSQRQPQQSLQYRRHEPLFESGGNQSNPFMHPESRATSQRHFPEPYRPPSTSFSNHFSSELSSGNGMGFGRIGSAQQQPPNTNQSQDNEQSMSRPA